MPTLKKFSITGAAGSLEGIAHLPDESPRAIAVVAHHLPTMSGTMENKVVTTLAKLLWNSALPRYASTFAMWTPAAANSIASTL